MATSVLQDPLLTQQILSRKFRFQLCLCAKPYARRSVASSSRHRHEWSAKPLARVVGISDMRPKGLRDHERNDRKIGPYGLPFGRIARLPDSPAVRSREAANDFHDSRSLRSQVGTLGVTRSPAGVTGRREGPPRLGPSAPQPSRLSVDRVRRRLLHRNQGGPATAQKDFIVQAEFLVELKGHAFCKSERQRSFSEVYSYFTPYLRYTNELHPRSGLNGRADKMRSRIGRSRSRYWASLPRSSLVRQVSRAIVLRLHLLAVVCPCSFCLRATRQTRAA